jgi:hypothetical protein
MIDEKIDYKSLAAASLLGLSSLYPTDTSAATQKPPATNNSSKSVKYPYTLSDIIAATLVDEAGGEKDAEKGMHAVLNVISKRAKGNLRQSAAECLKPYQFSGWNSVKVTNVDSVNKFINSKKSHPKFKVAVLLVNKLKDGKLNDITKKADHFLATRLIDTDKEPGWYNKRRVTVTIGNHTFLKLK